MSRDVRLDLDQERLSLDPGATGRLALTLRNTSDVVEHLQIEVRGLPPGGRATSEPPTVKLLPGAVAECAVVLELPREPLPAAGEHVLGVLAHSAHRREVSRCEEVRLHVPALPGLTLDVEPELVRAGSRAGFVTTLANTGNVPLSVALSGTDPERQVRLRFRPEHLTLAPGATAHAAVTATAPRPWTGQEQRRALTLAAGAAGVSAERNAAFVQPPRLPPVVLRALAGVVSLAVLSGTVVVAAQLARSEPGTDAQPQDQTASTAPPTAPPTDTPSGSALPSPPPTDPPPTAPGSTPPSTPPSTPTGSPTLEPEPVLVRFDDGVVGPGPRLVDGAAQWRADGLSVAASPGSGETPDDCADADAVVVHGAADDAFVTAARADAGDACNAAPLRVSFSDALAGTRKVTLDLAEAGAHVATAETDDGRTTTVRSRPGSPIVTVAADAGITSVTIAVDPDGAAPTRVGLHRVSVVPAED